MYGFWRSLLDNIEIIARLAIPVQLLSLLVFLRVPFQPARSANFSHKIRSVWRRQAIFDPQTMFNISISDAFCLEAIGTSDSLLQGVGPKLGPNMSFYSYARGGFAGCVKTFSWGPHVPLILPGFQHFGMHVTSGGQSQGWIPLDAFRTRRRFAVSSCVFHVAFLSLGYFKMSCLCLGQI